MLGGIVGERSAAHLGFLAGVRSCGIVRWRLGIVSGVEPVRRPLPHISGHVDQNICRTSSAVTFPLLNGSYR